MPVQKERKIYPQVTVPPPNTEEELFAWAQRISRAYEDLSKQIVEKFNLHVGDEEYHPTLDPADHIADATDLATAITRIAAILDALEAHGLVETT